MQLENDTIQNILSILKIEQLNEMQLAASESNRQENDHIFVMLHIRGQWIGCIENHRNPLTCAVPAVVRPQVGRELVTLPVRAKKLKHRTFHAIIDLHAKHRAFDRFTQRRLLRRQNPRKHPATEHPHQTKHGGHRPSAHGTGQFIFPGEQGHGVLTQKS